MPEALSLELRHTVSMDMYVILLGAPGAGKGTQASIMTEKLGLTHIATGDLFRQALAQGTALGKQAKSFMEQGKLVPDEITINMVMERLAAADCAGGVLLDGFPRNLVQAQALDRALGQQGKAIDKVVYIRVAEEELIKRLAGRWICRKCQSPYHSVSAPPRVAGKCDKCGGELYQRADDTEETVRKRLRVYDSETAPLIQYYTAAGKLLEIKGEGSEQEVGSRITSALKNGGTPHCGCRR